MFENLKIASLSDDQVTKIQALEEKLGKHIMAFEPGISIAMLKPDELRQLSELESELGVILLAYNKVK